MRIPLVYSASAIVNWHCSEEYAPGKWRPARCCGFNYWTPSWIKYRFRILWKVFIGRYDVINWGDASGEKLDGNINYRDITHPEFIRTKE